MRRMGRLTAEEVGRDQTLLQSLEGYAKASHLILNANSRKGIWGSWMGQWDGAPS